MGATSTAGVVVAMDRVRMVGTVRKRCIRCGETKPFTSEGWLVEGSRARRNYGKPVGRICRACAIRGIRIAAKIARDKQCRLSVSPEYQKFHNSVSRVKTRNTVLLAYGHACACCGERRNEFLAIDHVNGGGIAHRRDVTGVGVRMYRWIIRNGYPSIFRLLCHNCNCARGYYGYCPHEKEEKNVRSKTG